MIITAQDLHIVRKLKIIAEIAKSRQPIVKPKILKVDKDKLPIN